MEVKGTAFVARKALLEKKFGAAKFDAVLRAQAAVDPVFKGPILATSRLPMAAFLRLNERIVKELYGGDDKSYWEAGAASADFALGEGGPYRVLVTSRDVKSFVESAPRIYRTYFDEGEARAELRPDGVVLLLLWDIPIRHVYFEYAICGYFAHGLSLVSGKKVDTTCVRGFSKNDPDVRYELRLR